MYYRNQSKAIRLDTRRVIDKHGMVGVPRKRDINYLTEPHTPDSASKSLAKKRRNVHKADGKKTTNSSFKARPMPNFSKIKVRGCCKGTTISIGGEKGIFMISQVLEFKKLTFSTNSNFVVTR